MRRPNVAWLGMTLLLFSALDASAAVHFSGTITEQSLPAFQALPGSLKLSCFQRAVVRLTTKKPRVGGRFTKLNTGQEIQRRKQDLKRLTARGANLLIEKQVLRLKSEIAQLSAARRSCRMTACTGSGCPSSSSSEHGSLDSSANSSSQTSSAPSSSSSAASTGGLIIDHTAVRDFGTIPQVWLDRAKQLTFQYAHRSDGGNIFSGLDYLESRVDALKYSQIRAALSLPPAQTPPALRIYDGNAPVTYVTPADYWYSAQGRSNTEAVVGTGAFNYSMWSWCNELNYYSSSQVNDYFTYMGQLEAKFPGMRFIYMTGYTDGSNATTKANNNQIRNYARTNNKLLFDFADIESWTPDGSTYYPDNTRENSWAASWCSSHPSDCVNLPSCAHSHGMTCVVQGKAFWYMMARLAGWNGLPAAQSAAFGVESSPAALHVSPEQLVRTAGPSHTLLCAPSSEAGGIFAVTHLEGDTYEPLYARRLSVLEKKRASPRASVRRNARRKLKVLRKRRAEAEMFCKALRALHG